MSMTEIIQDANTYRPFLPYKIFTCDESQYRIADTSTVVVTTNLVYLYQPTINPLLVPSQLKCVVGVGSIDAVEFEV